MQWRRRQRGFLINPYAFGGGGGGGGDPMDDEFDGSSLDAKWTWRNQLATTAQASAVVSGGSLLMTSGATAPSPTVQAIEQSFSGSARFRALISAQTAVTNFNVVGIGLRDTGTGRVTQFGFHHNGAGQRLVVLHYGTETTFTGTALEIADPGQPRYLEIEVNATNCIFRDSPDNVTFTTRLTEARTTWLANPDRVGFQVTTFGGSACSQTADYFHREA